MKTYAPLFVFLVASACNPCWFGGSPEEVPASTTTYPMSALLPEDITAAAGLTCGQACALARQPTVGACQVGPYNEDPAVGFILFDGGPSVMCDDEVYTLDDLHDAGLSGLDAPCAWTCAWMQAVSTLSSTSASDANCQFASDRSTVSCTTPGYTACGEDDWSQE